MTKEKQNSKGITLIALVVTILILLILAGITITALFGEDGLITRARLADQKTQEGKDKDIVAINGLGEQLNTIVNGITGGEQTDNIPPTANISLDKNTVNVEEKVTATVTHTDNESGVKIENCKYIYNTTATQIETTSTDWDTATAFSINLQNVELTANTAGIYYLHVLTEDNAGNKTETISQAVTVEDPMAIYVTLYTDGTLAFSNNTEKMQGKEVQKEYGNIKDQVYKSSAPWNSEKESILTVTFNNEIIATATACWFYGCSNITQITNINYLNTSQVTNMQKMFYSCKSLTSLDLSNFNTSKVTDMSYMFYNCSSLTSLDVSNFDTSLVTNMGSMFNSCRSLTNLDLKNFDTSKVRSMGTMFSNCRSLTSLDLSNFNTSQATYSMWNMFYCCEALTSLNVSSFNTSNISDMGGMFQGCSNLTSLDVSNFNTIKATSMAGMFSGCSSLTSLNVSHFDTSNVTRTESMFFGCSSLTNLDVSNFDTSKVKNMGSMFRTCSGLTSLNVSNFNTNQVTDMSNMFNGCSGLTSLNLSNFNTSQVTNMNMMFYGCSVLTSLDVSSFNTSNISDMGGMFSGCSSLTSLDVSSFNTNQVTDMRSMFFNCSNLTKIYASSGFITTNVENSNYMFSSNTKLVGGNGTKYSWSNPSDKTYARIDTAGTPGYFTSK